MSDSNSKKPQVWIEQSLSYSFEAIREAVDKAISFFLRDEDVSGCRILVKPNLLSARQPERGVTTHPTVVEAVIDNFQAKGAVVAVGDSPAGAVAGLERVWRETGLLEVCKRRAVTLLNFEASGWTEKRIDGRKYRIARYLSEYDRIVNLAKAKTHVLTVLTGCVKNTFGCVPGFIKSFHHLENPSPDAMARVLVDVFELVSPWLSILDAVVAMDGHGPSSGRIRHLGFIAASRDAVAVDAVFASIVGIKPLSVPTTKEAYTRGIGEADLRNIEVRGASIDGLRIRDFEIPSNWKFRLIPQALSRLVSRFVWVRPEITERCTACGLCERVCAAKAIRKIKGRPMVIDEVCVSCLCCHEICPNGAIDLRRSWLARFLK